MSWGLLADEHAQGQAALDTALILAKARQESAPPKPIESRADAVSLLEQRVLDLARSRRDRGFYDRDVIAVRCASDDGAPVDEVTEPVTVFNCMAITSDPDAGVAEGYGITAQIDWANESMAWG